MNYGLNYINNSKKTTGLKYNKILLPLLLVMIVMVLVIAGCTANTTVSIISISIQEGTFPLSYIVGDLHPSEGKLTVTYSDKTT
ncbi:MAG: hypothetical protein LBE09_04195, partial [Christensenellaceae bacterium]|nr:hypothetical protein [Christensenellaceae bacterium]